MRGSAQLGGGASLLENRGHRPGSRPQSAGMRTDWPNGAEVAVSLTFDVDCESALVGRGETHKLSTLSEARFGATRGVPRILEILERHEIRARSTSPATPPSAIPTRAGRSSTPATRSAITATCTCAATRSTRDRQREEIERGLEALDARLGVTPRGYRSPSWELTPETLRAAQGARLRVGQQPDGRRPSLSPRRPARAARALEPRRLAAPAPRTRPRRTTSSTSGWPSSSRRCSRPPARHVHDAPGGDRPRLPRRAARSADHSDASERGQVWFATHGDVARWVTS